MPANVHTKADEALWAKAKAIVAAEHGSADNKWALVQTIYQNMKKGKNMRKAMQPLVDGLKQILDATHLLYLKTHAAHWNVTGPLFPQLHELFGSQYDDLHGATDELAERLRQMQVPVAFPASAGEGGPCDPSDLVCALKCQHEALVALCRETSKCAEMCSDQGTIDLLGRRMGAHDKAAWMLRSILEEPQGCAPACCTNGCAPGCCCCNQETPVEAETMTTSWVPMAMSFGEWMWAHGITKAASRETLVDGSQLMALPEIMAKAVTGQPKPGAKYIKRTPTGNAKRPWKYFYAVQHGGGVANKEHMTEGASFKHGAHHLHIEGVKDGKLIVKHTGTGERTNMTHDELSSKLAEHHGKAIEAHKTKLLGELEDARKVGNAKGVERLSAEAKKAGYVSDAVKPSKKKGVAVRDGFVHEFHPTKDEYTVRPATPKDKKKGTEIHPTEEAAHANAKKMVEHNKTVRRTRMTEEQKAAYRAKLDDVSESVKDERKAVMARALKKEEERKARKAADVEKERAEAAKADQAAKAAEPKPKGDWTSKLTDAQEKFKEGGGKFVGDEKAKTEPKPTEKPEHPDTWSGGALRTDEQLAADKKGEGEAKAAKVESKPAVGSKEDHAWHAANHDRIAGGAKTQNAIDIHRRASRAHAKASETGSSEDSKAAFAATRDISFPPEPEPAKVEPAEKKVYSKDEINTLAGRSSKQRASYHDEVASNHRRMADDADRSDNPNRNPELSQANHSAYLAHKNAANAYRSGDKAASSMTESALAATDAAEPKTGPAKTGPAKAEVETAKPEAAKAEAPKPTHADLVNKAKETYNLSDTEADKVHARSLKGGADKHVAAGNHDEAHAAVKQAVKDHLTLSQDRGMSPSKAKSYMDKHEALAAKKSVKKAFGSSFLEAFKTLSKGG